MQRKSKKGIHPRLALILLSQGFTIFSNKTLVDTLAAAIVHPNPTSYITTFLKPGMNRSKGATASGSLTPGGLWSPAVKPIATDSKLTRSASSNGLFLSDGIRTGHKRYLFNIISFFLSFNNYPFFKYIFFIYWISFVCYHFYCYLCHF